MNKTVLVTGSSRGIGRAIAQKFAKNGYNTVLNCHTDIARMRAAIAELGVEAGDTVIGLCADVGNYQEATVLFAEIERLYGGVDILINNAGIAHVGLFQDMEPDEWEKIIRVNLFSVMNCTKLAIPFMLKAGNGSIVNISSIWGECGASCEGVYSASKGAVNAFTKALAKELGPSGIRVNAISCGVINTEMNNFLNDSEMSSLVDSIPLGRIGSVEDIAKIAYFLSAEEPGYITGQIIRADGGML